jgi:hypothetical protein
MWHTQDASISERELRDLTCGPAVATRVKRGEADCSPQLSVRGVSTDRRDQVTALEREGVAADSRPETVVDGAS